MNNSTKLFELFSEHGISYCASVSGGGIMYLVDAVCQNKKMHTRFFHHEQSAAFAAESYARASGKIGVCLITIGPGVANAVAGAFSCFINSVPCIFISGAKRSNIETDYQKIRFNYPQDVDTKTIVSGVVKKFYEVSSGNQLEGIVVEAIKVANSGRPGPVWISIPLDIQGSVFFSSNKSASKKLDKLSPKKQDSLVDISSKVKKFIKGSKKPVFIIGRGAESVMRNSAYKNFLKKCPLPFITTIGSNHVIAAAGSRNLGFLGPTGRRAANLVLSEADSIIALGSGLDIDNTGFDRLKFFENKKVLIINSDPDLDISDSCKSTSKILIDIKSIDFEKLTHTFKKNFPSDFVGWKKFAIAVESLFSIDWEVTRNLTNKKVDPYYFLAELGRVLPKNIGIAGGISLDVHAFSHVVKLKESQEFFLSPHCGQLGWDLPAAVGICDSGKYDSVLCITGDGSAMFNIQELSTLASTKINATVIILDNAGYNSIRTSQDIHLSGRRFGSDLSQLQFPNWELLAKAFNFNFIEIKSNAEVPSMLPKLLEKKRLLVRVLVDPDRSRTPRLVSKISNGKFLSPNLAEQYPFLDPTHSNELAKLKSEYGV
ncbi:thiamine pyrophosphate-binding protein [Polynucleobacter paneuropaeus]|nr:thiamine pyrophosphate-binding protein [Polynucleobacter paneuropaeus]